MAVGLASRARALPLSEIGRDLMVVATLVQSIHLWSYRGFESDLWNKFGNLLILLLVVMLFRRGTPIRTGARPFELYALVFFLSNYIVQIPAAFFHSQPVLQGMYGLKFYCYWLIYWYLHSRNYPSRSLWKTILVLGAGWSLITIGQQFVGTPMFYSRFDSEGETPFEVRSGVSRFMIEGMAFGLITLFYAVQKMLEESGIMRRASWALLALIQLGGTLVFATRQVLVVALVCVVVQFILARRSQAWRVGVLAALGVGFLVAVPFVLASMGEVVAQTRGDLTTDNVRMNSIRYFVVEHWPSPLAWLVGNGRDVPGTSYAQELHMLAQSRGLFQIDIGILGDFSQMGLVYCLIVVASLIRGMAFLRDPRASAIGAMFLYMFLTLPLSTLYSNVTMVVFCAALLYLGDRFVMDQGRT